MRSARAGWHVVAVRVRSRLVPSGRVKDSLMLSPAARIGRAEIDRNGGGRRPGRSPSRRSVVVWPMRASGRKASRPRPRQSTPWRRRTPGMSSRPSPLAPRSAWLRSEIICFSPARAPSPSRICAEALHRELVEALAGEQIAVAHAGIEQADQQIELVARDALLGRLSVRHRERTPSSSPLFSPDGRYR